LKSTDKKTQQQQLQVNETRDSKELKVTSIRQVPSFTSSGLCLKNVVLFTSLIT